MEVLGINPIQRLVVPRVLAMVLVAMLLNGLVAVIGIGGGYFFNVVVQGGTPGAYLASFGALAQLPDLYVSTLKAAVFGVLAGVVASYKGLNPEAVTRASVTRSTRASSSRSCCSSSQT